ncbi:unnamed protein product [Cuscuta epithymum]|uniref:F-box domain-containing protein n=1 Tax=Cuscuta epithymum TaxID=186058 RepID=A0AAV0FXT0_9ASTE|nr:unnamed protein product [Cuscuta epithymum]
MRDKNSANTTQPSGENDFGGVGDFGDENVKNLSEDNDASNKQIKCSIDSLNALPDCLVIHILSFLDLEEAAVTSVLGKRWRYLWAELPKLEFYFWGNSDEGTKKISDFVARVHRTLATRKGKYLEKLTVRFPYRECFSSDVDNWVEFASKNKVKEIYFNLSSTEDLYTLCDMMYSYPSLTSLSLGGCILNPERKIEWQSLTSLEISNVDLPQRVVEKVLSCCSVLNSLNLRACWGFTCLKINSPNLCKLRVHDSDEEESEDFLEISAPYLKSLVLSLYPIERKLKLTNLSSLVSAHFRFAGYTWDPMYEDVLGNTKEIFENIQHVKELELGHELLGAIAALALDASWQLPRSTRKSLKINTFIDGEDYVTAIVSLLESSPDLVALVIDCDDPSGVEDSWEPPARDDLGCDLLHLKTVELIGLADAVLGGEPLLTLARVILKRATALEKMSILATTETTEEFVKIGQTLLTYPRSSPNAAIDFL